MHGSYIRRFAMNVKGTGGAAPSFTVFKTAIGWCGMVMKGRNLQRLFIGYSRQHQIKRHIKEAFRDAMEVHPSRGMRAIIKRLERYCSGENVALGSVPVEWSSLTAFQKKVLMAAAQIPCGSVDTYGRLARKIGTPRGARAVGNALAQNPFPLLIPCHRVIKGDGSLGGFSAAGGIELKRRLLKMERTKR
jgi:methylated-DNA-[protein]-cysteine S-methyltransferase